MTLHPRYRATLRKQSFRLVHTAVGTMQEGPAAIAVQYVAKERAARVVAVGHEAANLAEEIRRANEQGWQGHLPARLVSHERAIWWPPPERDAPLPFDTSAHDGESVILWPLEAIPRDTYALEALLRHVIARAHYEGGDLSSFVRPVIDIEWQLGALHDVEHDALVRALWKSWGRDKVFCGGEPLRLRGPQRRLRELPKKMRDSLLALLVALVAALAALAWMPARGVVLLAVCGVVALARSMDLRNWLRS